ncbi:MAG: hypothetical protein AB7E72_17750 [Lysobacterales bacterium]
MRGLIEQALLRQLAPISALVNDQGNILYLHGRTGLYLEPAPANPGSATSSRWRVKVCTAIWRGLCASLPNSGRSCVVLACASKPMATSAMST